MPEPFDIESEPAPRSKGETTRAALIDSALHLFGSRGFDGASTRQIAARAGANVAAIAYHFGGKDGLRLACIDEIAARFDSVLSLDRLPPPAGRSEACARLEAMLRAAVRFLVMPGPAQDFSRFLLREITLEGPMIEVIAERILLPRHRQLCALWAAATGGEPESEATRLAVFAMLGQMIYFRVGQPLILRRMGWDTVDAARADRIADILATNLRTALAVSERSPR